IWEIIQATEGSLAPVACLEGEKNLCPREDACITLPMWKGLNKLIHDYFSEISLEQLMEETKKTL
ncbi:MAG: Rrf2 family transcriptional regulator, partial [Bacillota bacterium]|nr:Rrf2 family transcriptional regulator [Bacillota bacterium]